MITYAEYTDIGKREKNEDSIASLCMENGGLFVLIPSHLSGYQSKDAYFH